MAIFSNYPRPSELTKDLSNATVTLSNSSFTYNGTQKTVAVSSVVLDGKTLTQDTDYVVLGNTGTNAGTYTVQVVGVSKYTGVANKTWTIAKAAGNMSLNKSSITLNASNLIDTITVTKSGDGAISAYSSNTNVCTVNVNGTTVTVTAVTEGSATITVWVAEGTNYLAPTPAYRQCSITYITIPANLSDATPAQIKYVANNGTGSTYWNVGDRTSAISIGAVGLMAATSACAFILSFSHNKSIEGSGIHFQFGKTTNGTDIAFVDSAYEKIQSSGTCFNMNNSQTNSGGWKSSRMRTTICSNFLSALPKAWTDVITSCKKYTDNVGNGTAATSNITYTSDKIWLLSEWEVFGSRQYSNPDESAKQGMYQYYVNGNSKIKYKHNDTSTACNWWLRSPDRTDTLAFTRVSSSGRITTNYANKSCGFAPGFRIS